MSALPTLGGAYAQATATRLQAQQTERQYNLNARIAGYQAEDAISRGEKEASRVKRSGKQIAGRQRAVLAAQGVSLDEGTPAEVLDDTKFITEADVMTVRNNAWRESWGFKAQALDLSGQAKFARLAGRFESRMTLLTGGLRAIGSSAQEGAAFGSAYSRAKGG